MKQPDLPIVCTLDSAQRVERQQEFEDLARANLVGRDREEGRVRLLYRRSDAVETAVRDLVRRESACCAFLTFDLRPDADALILEISGPAGAEGVLDLLYERSRPTESF
jgi:hypothetical protein